LSNKIINVLAVGRGEVPAFNVYRPEAAQLVGLNNSGAAHVTVITNADSVCVPYFEENGIRVITTPMDRKLSLHTIRCIRDELKCADYDVMYLINNTAISNGSFAAIGLPVKTVAYRGQVDNTPRYSPTSYLSILHPRIDMVVCVCKAVEKYVRAQQWGSKDKAATVYKGHDLSWYQNPAADLSALELPDDAIIVSLVADLRPRKGLDVLMAATHFFSVPAIHILLVGGKPEDPKVQQHIASSARPEQVHALGYRTDAPEISAASDFVVLPPSRREGLARAILEAMAYGRSAVVTDTGGNAELVVNGTTGLVVPVKDPRALGEAISKLASDLTLREKMGTAARQRLVDHFSLDQGVRDLLKVFAKLSE
jgi:glycosyltransferase involved in cell wall biosynthesis